MLDHADACFTDRSVRIPYSLDFYCFCMETFAIRFIYFLSDFMDYHGRSSYDLLYSGKEKVLSFFGRGRMIRLRF